MGVWRDSLGDEGPFLERTTTHTHTLSYVFCGINKAAAVVPIEDARTVQTIHVPKVAVPQCGCSHLRWMQL
jgi:hypothetical protein